MPVCTECGSELGTDGECSKCAKTSAESPAAKLPPEPPVFPGKPSAVSIGPIEIDPQIWQFSGLSRQEEKPGPPCPSCGGRGMEYPPRQYPGQVVDGRTCLLCGGSGRAT